MLDTQSIKRYENTISSEKEIFEKYFISGLDYLKSGVKILTKFKKDLKQRKKISKDIVNTIQGNLKMALSDLSLYKENKKFTREAELKECEEIQNILNMYKEDLNKAKRKNYELREKASSRIGFSSEEKSSQMINGSLLGFRNFENESNFSKKIEHFGLKNPGIFMTYDERRSSQKKGYKSRFEELESSVKNSQEKNIFIRPPSNKPKKASTLNPKSSKNFKRNSSFKKKEKAHHSTPKIDNFEEELRKESNVNTYKKKISNKYFSGSFARPGRERAKRHYQSKSINPSFKQKLKIETKNFFGKNNEKRKLSDVMRMKNQSFAVNEKQGDIRGDIGELDAEIIDITNEIYQQLQLVEFEE